MLGTLGCTDFQTALRRDMYLGTLNLSVAASKVQGCAALFIRVVHAVAFIDQTLQQLHITCGQSKQGSSSMPPAAGCQAKAVHAAAAARAV